MEDVEPPDEVAVQRIDRDEEHAHRDGGSEQCRDRPNRRFLLYEVCRDVETGAGRNDRDNDHHLEVAPDEGPVAMLVENLRRGQKVVDPPDAEGETHPGNANQACIQGPALLLDDGEQRRDGTDDALAECYDGEEAVPLSNVMRVPRRAPVP